MTEHQPIGYAVRTGMRTLAFGAAALLAGFSLSPEAKAVTQEKTIRVGVASLPPGRGNVYTLFGSPSMFTWYAMFDPVTLVDGGGNPIPSLASSWKNTSPSTWEFKLRSDVRFSNGEAFNANALVATLNWLISPEGLAKGAVVAGRTKFIKSARAVDDTTVVIETVTPNPIVPNEISIVLVTPPKAWADLGVDAFANAPVGTGPYKLEGAWQENAAKMTAFEGSFRAPKVRRLEVNNLPERAARFQAFTSGQLDVIIGISPDNIKEVQAANGKVIALPGPTVLTWALTQMNAKAGVDIKPLADPRVRQAMNMAISRDDMVKEVLQGYGQGMGQGVASPTFGHNPNVKAYPYDPVKARALLAEAGYPNGFDLLAEVREGYMAGDLEWHQRAGADLQKIGIRTKVQLIQLPEWLKKFVDVTWDGAAWISGWNSAPAMDAMGAIQFHTCDKGGKVYRCVEKEQKLVTQINSEFDVAKRKQLIHDLIQIQRDDAIALFLYEAQDLDAISNKLRDFKNVNRYLNYHEMSLAD